MTNIDIGLNRVIAVVTLVLIIWTTWLIGDAINELESKVVELNQRVEVLEESR